MSLQQNQKNVSRAEKRREQKKMRKQIKRAQANQQGNMIIEKSTVDKYIAEVKVGDVPWIISPDKNAILCLCQDVHKIKKNRKGEKVLSCKMLGVEAKGRTRALVTQRFIKAIVNLIELEEAIDKKEGDLIL